jgi:hypothetical protein
MDWHELSLNTRAGELQMCGYFRQQVPRAGVSPFQEPHTRTFGIARARLELTIYSG